MRSGFALAMLFVAAAFLLGCSSPKHSAEQTAPNLPSEGEIHLEKTLEPPKIPYHAIYSVGGAEEIKKEVWRKGQSARIDIIVTNKRALSYFIIGNASYSCTYSEEKATCFNITKIMSKAELEHLFPSEERMKEMGIAAFQEKEGEQCYQTPAGYRFRELTCFDSYGIPSKVERGLAGKGAYQNYQEYLLEAEHFWGSNKEDSAVFSLPAPVQQTPSTNGLFEPL